MMKLSELVPFGFEVHDLDLGTVTADQAEEIRRQVHVHGILVFRDQRFTDAQQIAFAANFGKFTQLNPEDRESLTYRFNNVEGVGRGSAGWHADNSWTPYPLKYIMLFGDNVTTEGAPLDGGATLFANAALVLERLPSALVAELSSLTCRLSARRNPDDKIDRPCTEHHPDTGQPYLVMNELLTDYVHDVSDARSKEILDEVFAALYDERYIYTHHWSDGDFVLWDNRLLHHARTAYDEHQNRVLRRCGIADDAEPHAEVVG